MQVTPRYDGPPVLRLDPPDGDPAVPLLRQRRRLADVLAGLDDEQWAAPSRCDRWSVRDVVAHLIGTNQFWTMSVAGGLAGEPTRFLANFDPVATPAQMVDAVRTKPAGEILDEYVATLEGLASVVTGLDGAAWDTPAETPVGHVALYAVSLHALWDSWTHERDILLPLGQTQTIVDDEVAGSLRYAAGIGPALRASFGSTREGRLAVVATDPDLSFVIEIGAEVVVGDGPPPSGCPVLSGDAVTLIEGLTYRTPLGHELSDTDRWLLGGLDEVFDVAPAAG